MSDHMMVQLVMLLLIFIGVAIGLTIQRVKELFTDDDGQ